MSAQETENPALAAILGQRQTELADLYKQASSMLSGMAKKRKKTGSEEEDTDVQAAEEPYDPVESAFSDRNTIMRDANAILDQDPEAKKIRRIKPENRPETFNRFMKRKYDLERDLAAVKQKRTQGEVENIQIPEWPPLR